MKKDSIMLTGVQRQSLEQILNQGKALAWKIKHAQVLLKVDRGPHGPGWSRSQIIEASGVSRSTVERICRLFREQGLDGALFRRPQPPRPQKRKVDGEEKPKHTWWRGTMPKKQKGKSAGACGWFRKTC
jgi:hypothetical protein